MRRPNSITEGPSSNSYQHRVAIEPDTVDRYLHVLLLQAHAGEQIEICLYSGEATTSRPLMSPTTPRDNDIAYRVPVGYAVHLLLFPGR